MPVQGWPLPLTFYLHASKDSWRRCRGERVKKKNRKEMAVMKRLKNTTQLQRRRHIGSLKNNYSCLPFEYTEIWLYFCKILTVEPIIIIVKVTQQCNGCTKQNKHCDYSTSNVFSFFFLLYVFLLYDYVFSLYVYVWLPWLRFFRVFSPVVRLMPG